MKKKIGIIGCGAIGKSLAKFIDGKLTKDTTLYAICDTNSSNAHTLLRLLKNSKPKITRIDDLIKSCDLIVESASAKISYEIAKKSLSKGKDVLVMSVGGIIQKSKELFKLAQRNQAFIFLPSGAICGLDGIKALSIVGIKKATLITRKPPYAIDDTGYLTKRGINLKKLKKETMIFKGKASDAVKYFPKNINVSALLSIASIGPVRTEVQIVTSPKYKRNIHEVIVESKAGKIRTISENVAFVENPKTSYMAALSAMSVLKGMFSFAKLGN